MNIRPILSGRLLQKEAKVGNKDFLIPDAPPGYGHMTEQRTSNQEVSCETQGHLWNGLGYCIMCKSPRPDWQCSECGEPCNASVPHTCYVDYRALKAEVVQLRKDKAWLQDEVNRMGPALRTSHAAYNAMLDRAAELERANKGNFDATMDAGRYAQEITRLRAALADIEGHEHMGPCDNVCTKHLKYRAGKALRGADETTAEHKHAWEGSPAQCAICGSWRALSEG